MEGLLFGTGPSLSGDFSPYSCSCLPLHHSKREVLALEVVKECHSSFSGFGSGWGRLGSESVVEIRWLSKLSAAHFAMLI